MLWYGWAIWWNICEIDVIIIVIISTCLWGLVASWTLLWKSIPSNITAGVAISTLAKVISSDLERENLLQNLKQNISKLLIIVTSRAVTGLGYSWFLLQLESMHLNQSAKAFFYCEGKTELEAFQRLLKGRKSIGWLLGWHFKWLRDINSNFICVLASWLPGSLWLRPKVSVRLSLAWQSAPMSVIMT